MNVFSIKEEPKKPIRLTQQIYNAKTRREEPYVVMVKDEVKSYALCPACQNPTMLVNRYVEETDSNTLYAKHTGYSVPDLASHNQAAYEACPHHNPLRFDNKTRRGNLEADNEIRDALVNHTHLVIRFLEGSTGITYCDSVIESMISHFDGNKGHEYKAINMYNLPFGFGYMTESQDLFGCKVNDAIAQQINTQSKQFKVNNYAYVGRINGTKGNEIRFYFNNHKISSTPDGGDTVELFIEEVDTAAKTANRLFSKKIEFDSAFFYNTYLRQERLRLLALRYL